MSLKNKLYESYRHIKPYISKRETPKMKRMKKQMNDSVILSINPKWCNKIVSGLKTKEVRKSEPKIKCPFKCYIYSTHPVKKVIGEFICDYISRGYSDLVDVVDAKESCLSPAEIIQYANGKSPYFWNITELNVYDNPRDIEDFGIKKAPQSWCYVKDGFPKEQKKMEFKRFKK